MIPNRTMLCVKIIVSTKASESLISKEVLFLKWR